MSILNISGYKFVAIDNTERLQAHFRQQCTALGIRGTILVSHEGLNVALAGAEEVIQTFKKILQHDARFADFKFKNTRSNDIPYRRLRIRIKDEIIGMQVDNIDPNKKTGKHLDAKTFKQWLDEGRDICVLDTRNDYEVKIGTFEKAINLNIQNFREFPEAVQTLSQEIKDKPVVMFCTGGVRCEKASTFCLNHDFKEIYQLDGGIIKYFEKCGDAHWQGECFVFDDRVAIKTDLNKTAYHYCLACLEKVTPQEMQSDQFLYNHYCPRCL